MIWRLTYGGVIVPMVSPIEDAQTGGGGRVDVAAVGRIVRHMTGAGIRGIFVLGTTGEGMSMTLEQRVSLVRETARAMAGITDAHLYVNISGTCLEESVEAGRQYLAVAAEMSVPTAALVAHVPFYFPLGTRAITRYFQMLADQIKWPLMIYNIPQTTHVSLAMETIEALLEHPRIVGMKDSDGDAGRLNAVLLRTAARKPGFPVLIGTSRLATLGMKGGAAGVVVSGANVDPDVWMKWWHAAETARADGEWAPADKLQGELDMLTLRYTDGRLLGDSIAMLKRLMQRRGLCGSAVLPPLIEEGTPDSSSSS